MSRGRRARALIPAKVLRAVLGLALAVALVALVAVAWTSRPEGTGVDAQPVATELPATSALTLAVLGDVPYSTLQLRNAPMMAGQINTAGDVDLVAHLGNIKNDASPCKDAYYREIRSLFDSFAQPLVYTPGQNEWANCHRPQNGGTSPLNRLGALRNFFFAAGNTALAQRSERFHDGSTDGYPENVRFAIAGTSFAAVHLVGSDNGLRPWTGENGVTRAQREEVQDRTQAAVQVLQDTFASAVAHGDRSVVIFTHADMFPTDARLRTPGLRSAYQPVVAALAEEAAAFPGTVQLFNSDSQVYRADQPLSADSPWLKFYGVTSPLPRLQRVTVDGAAQATGYLRVSIDYRNANPISWTRIPLAS
jgi:hypothetical protein